VERHRRYLELVEDLRAASGLDVEIAEPSGDLPYWRSGQ